MLPSSSRLARIGWESFGTGRLTASSPKLGVRACHAAPGDVWAYSTPILHASAPSQSVGHRRVLQLDFASGELPRWIDWLGV